MTAAAGAASGGAATKNVVPAGGNLGPGLYRIAPPKDEKPFELISVLQFKDSKGQPIVCSSLGSPGGGGGGGSNDGAGTKGAAKKK